MPTDATLDTSTSNADDQATQAAAEAAAQVEQNSAATDPKAAADAAAAAAGAAKKNDDSTNKRVKDWATIRSEIAGDDPKLLKRLERYSSEKDVVDALIAAQNKVSEKGTRLPKEPTPEQLAEWRTENSIPDKPEGYDLKALPDGRVIGDADKPFVDEFLKAAHMSNMNPTQVTDTVAWYLAEQERQVDARMQLDVENKAASEEVLREEWGSEYRLNKNIIDGFLNTAPEGVKDQLFSSRTPDGNPLGNNPDFLRWLATTARTLNPTATVVPGAGGNAAQAIETELEGIVKLMGDKTSAYWKGAGADKMQSRYRELVDVQQKLK